MTNRTDEILPTADERLALLPPPPERAVRRINKRNRKLETLLMFSAIGLAVALMAAALAWGTRGELSDRADRNEKAAANANQKADQATAQASTAAAAANEANRRLRAAGKPTVPVPTITPLPPVVVTPEGLSAAQIETVRAVITNELVGYKLPAAAVSQIAAAAAALVPKPKDGHTPTPAELKPLAVAAQAAYCADGKCIPKPGANGTPGRDGTPGTDGKDAPAVTAAQIQPIVAEAFTAYCNQESKPCDGQKGAQGEPGKQGEMGRGITSMTCPNDDNVLTADPWVIRWTSDPVQTEGGVCRAAGIP